MTTDRPPAGPPRRVLTMDEVLDLPDGTLVEIAWGGSPGPLRPYRIRHHQTNVAADNPETGTRGPDIREGDLVTLAPDA